MGKIRVLIVDDQFTDRQLVRDALSVDPAFELVGSAANGQIALAKIPQVNPDVVTLDWEMPEMTGLGTLKAIRVEYPHLPVVMVLPPHHGLPNPRLELIRHGANDYIDKPVTKEGRNHTILAFREILIPKLKWWTERASKKGGVRKTCSSNLVRLKSPPKLVRVSSQVDVVAIGVSTGGPNALAALLPTFPEAFPVPILIVQHMPPLFTGILARRLDMQSNMEVREAVAGDEVRPGRIFLAAGDLHMAVVKSRNLTRIHTYRGPPENSCRPAVDVLFRSVAEIYGGRCLALVMTGMGQDGLRGCERIHEAGGQILVQDESTSVVWGMPSYVAKAGIADRVLPLNELGPEIVRRVRRPLPGRLQ